jgi:bifunctional DNase/RNase
MQLAAPEVEQASAEGVHRGPLAASEGGLGLGSPLSEAGLPLLIRLSKQPMQEMVIYGVSFDMVGKQPIVLLKTRDGNKFLPIWIGHPEAAAILMKLQGANTPRPMTHDLISEMLSELEVSCTRVAVTELRENTFYAEVTLQLNGREIPIDSRPSDALALAVRTGAPIFAAEDVISESAIEFEHEVEDTEEVVEKFKDFLDNVTPEDFAGGADEPEAGEPEADEPESDEPETGR